MTDVDIQDFREVEQIMIAAYGMGRSVSKWQKYPPSDRDWFYSFKNEVKQESHQIGTTYNAAPVYAHSAARIMTYRIYFRRHEQAMYLALATS